MSRNLPFQKIHDILNKNVHCQTADPPLDFTIRSIKNSNKVLCHQLIFTNPIGGKLQLYQCLIPINPKSDETHNISSKCKLIIDDKSLLSAPTTLAESLRAERMRVSKQGITFYDLHFESSNLLFINDGLMYTCTMENDDGISDLKMLDINNAMSVKRNPSNWRLIAFLKGRDVFVIDISQNKSTQLTSNGPDTGSGCTHYIIQEEFGRLDGMWWRPIEDNEKEYHLLIEEFDESDVEKLIIPCYTFGFEHEEYRYPQAGNVNAKSTLKLLKIKANSNIDATFQCDVLELANDFWKHLPDFEYLTNAGWTSDGKFVWVQLADRLQNCLSTYLLPFNNFSSTSKSHNHRGYVILLNREINNKYWVPVNMNTIFLKSCQTGTDYYTCSYIIGQSCDGYNHLYLNKSSWKIPTNTKSFVVLEPETVDSCVLTRGPWEVDIHKLWINETDEILYFLANRDDILANHLYSLNYGKPTKDLRIQQITNEDSVVFLNPEQHLGVVTTTSLESSLRTKFINLQNLDGLSEYTIFELHNPFSTHFEGVSSVKRPRLLKYNIIDDFGSEVTLYGLLYLPNSDKPRPWPTLHYVYGGPGVRMIENNYNKNFVYFAQKINHFGFALLVCDGRGSTRRGLNFEGNVKNKMGTVELIDQIDFLRKAAADTGLIDLERVAIYGSSYGGYLTIMAMFKHSDVYKCGFSCSPVVDFRFYDTAYTERYMGIPDENVESYNKASVLIYISNLPKDRCRLIVAHGGKDENVHFLHTANLLNVSNMLGHDIKFLFYPSSRHGIKDRTHLESHLIKFLQEHLNI